jgi:hypothetical protein
MPLNDQKIQIYRRHGLAIPPNYRMPNTALGRFNALSQELLENN